jgi:selenium metabolism protein YedF
MEDDMSITINAKGLACPQPVLLTKKALESNDELTIHVDNATAFENVKRFATASGCDVETKKESDGVFGIKITKKKENQLNISQPAEHIYDKDITAPTGGPMVFVIASNMMGSGNDELGAILMKSFVNTTTNLEHCPDIIILYNAGVKLATVEGGAVDDLKALEEKGVKILVCGTCVNFFELNGKIMAGNLSNMYEIADTLSTAGRIVKP